MNNIPMGLVETKGFVGAVEAVHTMTKAADEKLIFRDNVGNGIVTISVTGDIGAVKTAVDIGTAVVK